MLPASTHIRSAELLVDDLPLISAFYQDALGFTVTASAPGSVTLNGILTLTENKSLPYPPDSSAGLYHIAFLFDSAGDLARTLLSVFQKASALFQGPGDHLVSQAFYLTDPAGNGIELYVDRPREEWQYVDGQIQMGSLPIDIPAFLAQHIEEPGSGKVTIGHMHLKVGDIAAAKRFYADALGFDVVVAMPTALFVSAGGYHHHIGLNAWESLGAGMREPALGLASFEIACEEVDELAGRLEAAGFAHAEDARGLRVQDPWGTEILITGSGKLAA